MDEQAIALLTKKIVSDVSFWSAVIGLIGVFIGAFITGLFSFFQSKQSIDSDKAEKKKVLFLLKYECMYRDLGSYSKYVQDISVLSIQSIDSGLNIRELKSDLKDNDFIMHSKFYTPTLSDQTKDLVQKLRSVITPLSELILIADNTQRTEKEEMIGRIVTSSLELDTIVENIKQELTNLTNELIQT
jgi:hypothetical protein